MGKLKEEDVAKVISLRKKGYSIPEISSLLKIPKTTVFRYVKAVKISSKHRKSWLGKRGGSKKLMILKKEEALKEANKLMRTLSEKDKLLFLSALYWAEGSKKDFGLSNTDPELIRVFMFILRTVLKIDDGRFRASIRIYQDLNKNKCLAFWSSITGLPKEKFLSINVLPGKKVGKLEYGMCRIRVSKGGDILKKINGINISIANYASKQYKRVQKHPRSSTDRAVAS